MKSAGKNVWIAEQDQIAFGVNLGTRMTLIKSETNNDLLAHSPIKPSKKLINEISKQGDLKWIVGPNKFHHLYIDSFRDAFPEAKVFLAPGLKEKRNDIADAKEILSKHKYPWSDLLDFHVVHGAPLLNEVVFFHKTSKSLIVTDLGLNFGSHSPLKTRIFAKIFLTYNKFGWSKLEKMLFIKDRSLFKESLEKILLWDFEQILLPHGEIVTSNAKEQFQKAFNIY